MMTKSYDVAEAKSQFSDLLNRAGYRGERFLIRKRGRPIAAIVGADDLARLESTTAFGPTGLLAAADAIREFDDYPAILDAIVDDRGARPDREVDLDLD
jgi:prevent-host-death family protein